MLGYFSVSIIHRTLTWTIGSLIRVHDLFCMCIRKKNLGLFTTFFTCRVSMQDRCHVWSGLTETCNVALSYFTLSTLTIFTDVSLREPEDSFNSLRKAFFIIFIIHYNCHGPGNLWIASSERFLWCLHINFVSGSISERA